MRFQVGDLARSRGSGHSHTFRRLGEASRFNDLRENLDRRESVHYPVIRNDSSMDCHFIPRTDGTIVRPMKTAQRIYREPEGHWVGDGFPVRTVLDYQRHPALSPFILLDHFGPADFTPAEKPRGVGWHPHRGFETVTVLDRKSVVQGK